MKLIKVLIIGCLVLISSCAHYHPFPRVKHKTVIVVDTPDVVHDDDVKKCGKKCKKQKKKKKKKKKKKDKDD